MINKDRMSHRVQARLGASPHGERSNQDRSTERGTRMDGRPPRVDDRSLEGGQRSEEHQEHEQCSSSQGYETRKNQTQKIPENTLKPIFTP